MFKEKNKKLDFNSCKKCYSNNVVHNYQYEIDKLLGEFYCNKIIVCQDCKSKSLYKELRIEFYGLQDIYQKLPLSIKNKIVNKFLNYNIKNSKEKSGYFEYYEYFYYDKYSDEEIKENINKVIKELNDLIKIPGYWQHMIFINRLGSSENKIYTKKDYFKNDFLLNCEN